MRWSSQTFKVLLLSCFDPGVADNYTPVRHTALLNGKPPEKRFLSLQKLGVFQGTNFLLVWKPQRLLSSCDIFRIPANQLLVVPALL